MKRWKVILGLSLTSALLLAGCSGQVDSNEPEERPEVLEEGEEEEEERQLAELGKEAPLFELMSLDGESYNLKDFRGKPVLLNFYSKNCRFCIDKFPELNRIYNENKDWVEIMAINVGEPATYSEEIRDEHGLNFPMLLDEDIETSIDYMVRSVPFTVFIDSEGVIRAMELGPLDYEYMVNQLENLKKQ